MHGRGCMLVQHRGRAHSEWHGFPVPDIITQEMDKLKSFPLHPDHVWVVAYPKAGSTWTQQIVRLVRNGGQDDGKVIG